MPEAESVARPLVAELEDALRGHGAGLRLRPETDADLNFLIELYTEYRWDELEPAGWPDAARRAFLEQQCRLQRQHYAVNYLNAELLIIERCAARESGSRQPIGRIYLHSGHDEIRLMDILLRQRSRGSGIGSLLLEALMAEARRRRMQITLHVEPENPAQRLYRRLGFGLREQRGAYDFLGWSPEPMASGPT